MGLRRWILAMLVGCWGLVCMAQDHLVFESSALAPQDQGSATIACRVEAVRAGVSVKYRILDRIAVEAIVGSATPLALTVQAYLVQQQPILHLGIRAGTTGMDLLGTLDFGPVILEAGGHWIGERSRWARVEFSPHPRLTLMIGLTESLGAVEPLAGFRLSPNGHPAWSVLCGVRGDRPTLLVSGVLP